MDDNPFQSPQSQGFNDVIPDGMDPRRFGAARQVPVVAILMIVHGALLTMVGIGFFALSIYFTNMMMQQLEAQQQMAGGDQPFPAQSMKWIFQGTYGGMGGVLLIAGLLNIVAGARNYSFRGRTLGIISLVGGMASLFTCWGLPLSLALLIYGLIIYFSQEAERAFHWQEAKARRGEI